jgi:hypothetical protein
MTDKYKCVPGFQIVPRPEIREVATNRVVAIITERDFAMGRVVAEAMNENRSLRAKMEVMRRQLELLEAAMKELGK